LLKFGSYERFFYCVAYRSDYKKKYGARTEVIKKKTHRGKTRVFRIGIINIFYIHYRRDQFSAAVIPIFVSILFKLTFAACKT